MAACHLRSVSLPTGSHPLTASIEEQLYKLKASHSSSIGQKLNGLKNLFECVDDLLQLPTTQQNLNMSGENALNGSIELLDMCDTTRDFLSQMKECVQGLELSLRRRKGGDFCLTSEVDAYMVSRKKLNKLICKSLRNLKRKERNCSPAALNSNSNTITMLRDVEEISVSAFKFILSFISVPRAKSKSSIISKLLQSKRVSCEVEASEIENIDAELLVLKSSKDIKHLQIQNVLKGLESLESSIKEAEEELECIYRQLVKTRVSLLNILNN
ncbi:hypothetical protein JCGZ_12438 [Jatropha curcas]|uniref:Uncharacterized protein n=1 Tax=Jatropha curcas TaxID=180498 RepID=A0A067K785_JATCU|nr:uncharacterized protein LOC105639752 [Jatropha curcas]KDP31977.1 hypothetical protein JCGZ_12438 [Jatropha curcas]